MLHVDQVKAHNGHQVTSENCVLRGATTRHHAPLTVSVFIKPQSQAQISQKPLDLHRINGPDRISSFRSMFLSGRLAVIGFNFESTVQFIHFIKHNPRVYPTWLVDPRPDPTSNPHRDPE
ncbi:hypothetical protein PIB30_023345 [Stylosanthes scabra]|uniref:Uncharacterized protein n=1 Tax=Stylosanthes scabra TaxID=79078 RepID=A0ABU6TBF5_9FABA|nr:hypothetical protein [Stylosanthes scabra]